MSVLLRKPPATFEVYNDIDAEVVAFFAELRENTEELIRAIQLTPFSRAELDLAFQETEDPLERARRFYIRAWQSWGGPRGMWRTGWRYQRSNARGKRAIDDWNDTGHLREVVARLKDVQIECDAGLNVIERFDAPTSLFYVDPPYLFSTRSGRWSGRAYTHELEDADHVDLARMLQSIDGMAIVSGYPSELYDTLYAGWTMVTKETVNNVSAQATEALWLSPAAMAARLPLFAQL
jgi:DNA adenine methylase